MRDLTPPNDAPRERDVPEADGVRWACVQAPAGVPGAAAREAAEQLAGDDGTVPVVCTPGGGAESVRVALPIGWESGASDDGLPRTITGTRR